MKRLFANSRDASEKRPGYRVIRNRALAASEGFCPLDANKKDGP